MRILVSADWHLGYTLGGANQVPRLDDQARQLRRIAAYCDEHAVDVLAIAGDVFEAQDKGGARAAVGVMMDALTAPLSRGLRIVAIAGNHDRDYFMDLASTWLGAHAPEDGERIILRTRPELLTVEARGERASFALLPFPYPHRYELRHDDAGGVAQRNEQLARLFINKMEELRRQASELRLPTVLLAHVTVTGTTVKAHRISPRDDVVIPRGAFPEFELTVVGHIHKAEQLGGGHFYYVGSIDRMDVGERDNEPRVLLADVGPTGVREVTSLPLDPTPFAAIVASDEPTMAAARDAIDRPDQTLVRLTLEVPRGTYLAPLLDLARRLFPRLYGNVECAWTDVASVAPSVEGLNPADVDDTVRRYLEGQEIPEDERAELLTLLAELRAIPVGADA